jgi:16S rRNA (guanine527-N7)-methyltransferase
MDGLFIAMKGPKLKEELDLSKHTIGILGGEILENIEYNIDNQVRSLLVVSKVRKTEKKYPRKFNQIKNNPL